MPVSSADYQWFAYSELAERLGLTLTEVKRNVRWRVHGMLLGQAVQFEAWNDGENLFEEVRAMFEPELDLGLSIGTKPLVLPGLGSVSTGDDDWDSEAATSADEPERARTLLGPELRGPILKINIASPGFSMVDTHIAMAPTWAAEDRMSEREAALRSVANLGRAVDAARSRVPCAAPLRAHSAAWSELARRYGLATEQTPLRAAGTIGRLAWSARTRRVSAHRHAVEFRATWPEIPLGAGLTVRRETLRDKLRSMVTGADVRLDDERFDRAFWVVAEDAERARRLLDERVRSVLLDAADAFGALVLTDDGLTLGGDDPLHPACAEKALGIAELVADRIARIRTPARAPYR